MSFSEWHDIAESSYEELYDSAAHDWDSLDSTASFVYTNEIPLFDFTPDFISPIDIGAPVSIPSIDYHENQADAADHNLNFDSLEENQLITNGGASVTESAEEKITPMTWRNFVNFIPNFILKDNSLEQNEREIKELLLVKPRDTLIHESPDTDFNEFNNTAHTGESEFNNSAHTGESEFNNTAHTGKSEFEQNDVALEQKANVKNEIGNVALRNVVSPNSENYLPSKKESLCEDEYFSVEDVLDIELLHNKPPHLCIQPAQSYDSKCIPSNSKSTPPDGSGFGESVHPKLLDPDYLSSNSSIKYLNSNSVSSIPQEFKDSKFLPVKTIDYYNKKVSTSIIEELKTKASALSSKDGIRNFSFESPKSHLEKLLTNKYCNNRGLNHLVINTNNEKSPFSSLNCSILPKGYKIEEGKNVPPSTSYNKTGKELFITKYSLASSPNNSNSINECNESIESPTKKKFQTIVLKKIKVKNKRKGDKYSPKKSYITAFIKSTVDGQSRQMLNTATVSKSCLKNVQGSPNTQWTSMKPPLPGTCDSSSRLPSTLPVSSVEEQLAVEPLQPITVSLLSTKPVSRHGSPNDLPTSANIYPASLTQFRAETVIPKSQSIINIQAIFRTVTSNNQPNRLRQLLAEDSTGSFYEDFQNSRLAGSSTADSQLANNSNKVDIDNSASISGENHGDLQMKRNQDNSLGKKSGFYFDSEFNRRKRPSFSMNQLKVLQRRFERSQYVPKYEMGELANFLELSQLQVKMWFQNRRSKYKKLSRKAASIKNHNNSRKILSDFGIRLNNLSKVSTTPVNGTEPLNHSLKIQLENKNIIIKSKTLEDTEGNLTLRSRTAPAHINYKAKITASSTLSDKTKTNSL